MTEQELLFKKKMIAYEISKHGISYSDIAILAGVTDTTISKWVNSIDDFLKSGSITKDSTLQQDIKAMKYNPKYTAIRRALSGLLRYNYWKVRDTLTWSDLAKLTYEDFIKMRRVGKKAIEELKNIFMQKEIKSRLFDE